MSFYRVYIFFINSHFVKPKLTTYDGGRDTHTTYRRRCQARLRLNLHDHNVAGSLLKHLNVEQ